MYFYKSKNEAANKNPPRFLNQKMIFDMVKSTNSSPIFKKSGAKNVFYIVYQILRNISLTAMPSGVAREFSYPYRGFHPRLFKLNPFRVIDILLPLRTVI
jgi:hypothetical protein